MTSAGDVAQDAKDVARRAADSPWLGRLARLGLVGRGLIYVLIGWLALQVALGRHGTQADRGGAIRAIAAKSYGPPLLWVLALGFVGLALWRFSEAAFGADGSSRDDKGERAQSLARALLYTVFAVTTVTFVAGTSRSAAADSNKQSVDVTASLMKHSGGRVLIGLVGLVLVAIGAFMAYEGVAKKFEKHLKLGEMSPRGRSVVEKLGMFGGVARGLVFGLAGVFLLIAAISFDAGKARGLDGTLRAFAANPVGPVLLGAVALGLAAFGVFSMCEARWRKV